MPGAISEEQPKRRPIGRPFPPGVSGNPSGRPKKILTSSMLRELTAPALKAVALALIDKAKDGDVRAISELFDRVEGRAAAAQEDRDAVANAITADRLADLLDLAASRLKGK